MPLQKLHTHTHTTLMETYKRKEIIYPSTFTLKFEHPNLERYKPNAIMGKHRQADH